MRRVESGKGRRRRLWTAERETRQGGLVRGESLQNRGSVSEFSAPSKPDRKRPTLPKRGAVGADEGRGCARE